LKQEQNGSLSKEIQAFIKENPDEFKGLNLPGLVVNDADSRKTIANGIVKDTCVFDSLYGNMVLEAPVGNLSSIPASYPELYLKAYQNELIQSGTLISKGQSTILTLKLLTK
jgi:hypothetical protein